MKYDTKSDDIKPVLQIIAHDIHPLDGSGRDYDRLMDKIGNACCVLLGEASHGTHEFYRERAHITRRLIEEKGFDAVAVEADWPDAYRVNRYVKGLGDSLSAVDALSGFRRFPTWMWRNTDVVEFLGWLREHNDGIREPGCRVGFYGLDLYGLYASIEAVLAFLDKVDPEAAKAARKRYACFEMYEEDLQQYGYMTSIGLQKPCEEEAIRQLTEIQRQERDYAVRDGRLLEGEIFNAEQNARLIRNAERYYRAMFSSRTSSWNLRDMHMTETLGALMTHLQKRHARPKIVIWAHNSHIGDARATQMGQIGELNIGQLARQRFGKDAVLVGFSTFTGTVTAATDWGLPALRRHVRPALSGSYEYLFHRLKASNFFLWLRDAQTPSEALAGPLLQRAIGVIYQPETERQSHYFRAQLPLQFDAVIHFDETRAVEPLERSVQWERGEIPETFPSSF